MFKTIFRFTVLGFVGLMISSPAAVSGLFGKSHKKEEQRAQVSPACHPTYGYHQTCWRRFPALPPCENCDTCPTATCHDGNCELPPVFPHPVSPVPLQEAPFTPSLNSGRYGASMSAPTRSAPMSLPANFGSAVAGNSAEPAKAVQQFPVQIPGMASGRYGQALPAASMRRFHEPVLAARPSPSKTSDTVSGWYGIATPVAASRQISVPVPQATTSQSQRYHFRAPTSRPAVASRTVPVSSCRRTITASRSRP